MSTTTPDDDGIGPDQVSAVSALVPPLGDSYRRIDMIRDFRRVFLGSDEGRRVLGHLLAWCGHGASGLTEGLSPSESLLIHEGKRSIGISLMGWLQTIPSEPDLDTEPKVIYGGRNRDQHNRNRD